MTSKELAKLACDALDDKKALEIKVINIENVSTLADYFIIASGTNHNQVQAMADNVDETLGRAGYEPKQIMPLPEFKKIENVNIISYEDNLQIDVDNELIDDKLYKNIFGKRIFLITYEDENNLDTYQISSNHFLIKKHNDRFKINIVETYENNNKITGESFTFYSY